MPTPRKFERPMTEQVILRMTPYQLELAAEAADQKGMQLTDFVRDLVLSESIAITGKPGSPPPEGTGAYKVNTSKEVKSVKPPWESATERGDEQESE